MISGGLTFLKENIGNQREYLWIPQQSKFQYNLVIGHGNFQGPEMYELSQAGYFSTLLKSSQKSGTTLQSIMQSILSTLNKLPDHINYKAKTNATLEFIGLLSPDAKTGQIFAQFTGLSMIELDPKHEDKNLTVQKPDILQLQKQNWKLIKAK